MRELTESETAVVSGGNSDMLRHSGFLSQATLRSIHTEVRAQMARLMRELEKNAHHS